MKPRTRARSIALQALYEIDITGHPPALVIEERLSETPLEDNLSDFARKIVFGIQPLIYELDQLIAKHAPEWPLDQVATIDRNIMRIALWEIAVSNQTPLKVAINEAVELGKIFGSESTPRFVNGVLGSLALHYNDIIQYFKKLN
ncbi:MAG: transcription antitermination factor NusB [Chloroflexi bacterium RBG_16_47_49]|nr:MAG: transcription antitermination factor NusB [Chloroflexi bacterium RBG_16_47_49]